MRKSSQYPQWTSWNTNGCICRVCWNAIRTADLFFPSCKNREVQLKAEVCHSVPQNHLRDEPQALVFISMKSRLLSAAKLLQFSPLCHKLFIEFLKEQLVNNFQIRLNLIFYVTCIFSSFKKALKMNFSKCNFFLWPVQLGTQGFLQLTYIISNLQSRVENRPKHICVHSRSDFSPYGRVCSRRLGAEAGSAGI